MKKLSLIKLLGIGAYTLLKASIPFNAHCPTAEKYISIYPKSIEYKSTIQDTTNLKKTYVLYDLCKEN